MVEFGELVQVDLRDAWHDEPHSFTPWLAENLSILSREVGIQMVAEGTEVPVEQFSADILARNPQDNSLVLIENQLTGTDHTHLGQVLTYVAGLRAQTIIWVARDFTNPHLSAIRWLNEHTVEPYSFFAVRVKVVRIGSSPLAPVFEVLERPNDWERQVRAREESKELTGVTKIFHDFWQFYGEKYAGDLNLQPAYKSHNFFHRVKGLHIRLYINLSGGEVGINIQSPGIFQPDKSAIIEQDNARILRCRTILLERGVELWEKDTGISLAIDDNAENKEVVADWFHEKLATFCSAIESLGIEEDLET